MARKIYIKRGRASFLSFPIIALFMVLAVGLFAFFGFLSLIALGVLGAGASVLGKLFPGRGKKGGSRVGGRGRDTITLGKSDYEIKDLD